MPGDTTKTAQGFADFALSRVGGFYVYGTFGRYLTKDILDYVRKTYPKQLSVARYNKAMKERLGKRTRDCIGLLKEYLWLQPDGTVKYNAAQDVSANGMRALCKIGGAIATFPGTVGALVFMDGHVGVYVGGGQVVEARGFDYGVVKTALKSRPWTHWGLCPWLAYQTAPATEKPAQGPTEDVEGFQIGDRVWVKPEAAEYYPGLKMPDRVPGKAYTVGQVLSRGAPVVKGGKPCVLLEELVTWCAVENLEKMEE